MPIFNNMKAVLPDAKRNKSFLKYTNISCTDQQENSIASSKAIIPKSHFQGTKPVRTHISKLFILLDFLSTTITIQSLGTNSSGKLPLNLEIFVFSCFLPGHIRWIFKWICGWNEIDVVLNG